MITIPLSSGSHGNSIYIEVEGIRLVIDAGISGKIARERLAVHDRDMQDVDALLISHDHLDHSKSAGIFQRMFDLHIHVTTPTLAATFRRFDLGRLGIVRNFNSGSHFDIGNVHVETYKTPHDATDGVGFVINGDGRRLGVFTDMGYAFDELKELLPTLDALVLESNYDEQMLADGPYPDWLKRRVAGRNGHLSNRDSAELVRQYASDRLQWVCLAHISQENNTPEMALATYGEICNNMRPVFVAPRHEAGQLLPIK